MSEIPAIKRSAHALPSVSLITDEPLDTALERVQEVFRLSHFVPLPYETSLPKLRPPLEGFLACFHTLLPSGEGVVVFVCTEPWDYARALAFVDLFLALLSENPRDDQEEESRLQDFALRELMGGLLFWFYSAYPLHPMVDYVFGRGLYGRLEAASLWLRSQQPLTTATAPALAVRGRAMISRRAELAFSWEGRSALKRLNDFVLLELRAEQDIHRALPLDSYRPDGLLGILGCILGEFLRASFPGLMRWVQAPPQIGDGYPALEWKNHSGDLCYLFPIDRVYRCFQFGKEQDLLNYFDLLVVELLEGHTRQGETSEHALEIVLPVLKSPNHVTGLKMVSVSLLPESNLGIPCVTAALNHPQSLSYVSLTQLVSWDVSVEVLLGRACANLARLSRDMHLRLVLTPEQDLPMLCRLMYDDAFNASRILLAEQLFVASQRLTPGSASFWVGVPSRDELLVYPRGSEEEFSHFQVAVRRAHESHPSPISSLCFLLEAQGVVGVVYTNQ